MSILTPHVGEAIMKWTSVDEVIEKNCMEIFAPAEIAEKEEVSLQEQIQTIEQAELPEFFKQILSVSYTHLGWHLRWWRREIM